MKIQEMIELWTKDCSINYSDLASSATIVGQLHGKYLNIYSNERIQVLLLDKEFKTLLKDKQEHYLGSLSEDTRKKRGWEPNPLKILRQDLGLYLEADKDLQDLNLRISLQREKINYLENVINHLKNRGYLIKTILDIRKFEMGA